MARVYTNGFEYPTMASNGLVQWGESRNTAPDIVRKSPDGNGGVACARSGSSQTRLRGTPFYPTDELYARVCFRQQSLSARTPIELGVLGGSFPIRLETSTGTGELELFYDNVKVAETTSSPLLQLGIWYRIEMYVLLANTGVIEVRVDDIPVLEWQGDTSTVYQQVNSLGCFLGPAVGAAYIDDIAVNTPDSTIYYHGGLQGSPTPTVGEILTGPYGTAEIRHFEGNEIEGLLYVRPLTGTFNLGETLTDPQGFEATCSYGISSESTSWCGEGYVQLFSPVGDGEVTQLNSSTGTNYEAVNQIENTTHRVYGDTPGMYDTYLFGQLPSDAKVIKDFRPAFYCQKESEGLDYIKPVIRISGVDYEIFKRSVGTGSYSWRVFPWMINPATQAAWTVADFNALGGARIEMGPKISD